MGDALTVDVFGGQGCRGRSGPGDWLRRNPR